MANDMFELGADEDFGADEEYGADDELSGLELYGADDELSGLELYGARPRGVKALLRKQQRQIASLRRGNAAMRLGSGAKIQETGPSADREFPVNFASDSAIAAGATASIRVAPQVQLFRGERLVIPETSVGQYFVLNDVLVGKNSQIAGTGTGMSAVVFSEKSVGVAQRYDPCSLGMVITISVTNVDTNPRSFRATLLGRAIFLDWLTRQHRRLR